MRFSLPATFRISFTLAICAAAVAVGTQLWRHYELEPWTRDGRVNTNIVQVAPDVTGQVTKVFVRDNQLVAAGQVLFEIDRARFELALRQAQVSEKAQRAALAQARELGEDRVEQIQVALEQAVVNRDVAKLNLERTRVVSAVDGYVTNLDLQVGAYASAGRPVMALVDRNAFYVEGYFEETKLAGIHKGDPVQVLLMGWKQPLAGHVDSFANGISDRDRSTGSNFLPNVNPAFNWVRLAQRIPVRIALDPLPQGVRLVAGQTATVEVLDSGKDRGA